MAYHHRLISGFLLLCLLCCGPRSSGQSLTVLQKDNGEYWLVGAVPEDQRYVLQASSNVGLWIDINDQVSGVISNRLQLAGIHRRYFRLVPWTEPAPPIRMALVGDSTVATGIGWGDSMSHFVKSNLQFVNLAQSRFSTKIFLASEQHDHMIAIRPNYVLLLFGLIDWFGCSDDPTRCGTTLTEHEANLRTIVQTVREFEGTPVLITPTRPRLFDTQGKLQDVMQDRVALVKRVAAELQTPLIDLDKLTAETLTKLGKDGSAYLYLYPESDPFHYSPLGRELIAGLVANALPNALGPYLTNLFENAPSF